MTQGVEAIGLASTTVLLPSGITTKPVASLNHAYTKLSETFETWRISHGKVCLGTGLPFVHVVKGLVLFVDEFHFRVFLGILGARIDPLDVRAAAERSHEVRPLAFAAHALGESLVTRPLGSAIPKIETSPDKPLEISLFGVECASTAERYGS